MTSLYYLKNKDLPFLIKNQLERPPKIGEETNKKNIEEVKMDCESTAMDIAANLQINHN